MITPGALATALKPTVFLVFALASAAPAQSRPSGRPFVTVMGAVPVVTYVAASGPRAAQFLTPSDRLAFMQVVGGGYVVNPRFRIGVVGMFSQALTHLPQGAPMWQLGGVAPIAIRTLPRFFVGGGPIFAYRSGGVYQSDLGALLLSGMTFRLGQGLALNVAAPVSGVFRHRRTVSLSLAAGVTKVF